jgi:hypothetical protein
MRNIYDIFEERKFDVFYIEHFSFNDLDEIDMVFENIERYILDDNYVLMEGFKDKIKDIKGNVRKKIKIFIQTIRKFFQDILIKFNTKYEPLKKHIEKVGKEEIIKKLEGRKVRMPNFIEYNFDGFLSGISNDFDLIKEGVKEYDSVLPIDNGFARGNKFHFIANPTRGEQQYFEGKLTKKHIENLFSYVFNYKKFVDITRKNVENISKILDSSISNTDDTEKINNAEDYFKLVNLLSRNIMAYVNKALIISAKLMLHIKVDDKLPKGYNHDKYIDYKVNR